MHGDTGAGFVSTSTIVSHVVAVCAEDSNEDVVNYSCHANDGCDDDAVAGDCVLRATMTLMMVHLMVTTLTMMMVLMRTSWLLMLMMVCMLCLLCGD